MEADEVVLHQISGKKNAIPGNEKENIVKSRKHGLKREINLLGGVAIYVGIIIGSGIFISPTLIAHRMQSTGGTLLVWTGCGAVSMLCASIWMELGTMFPNSSGGTYDYLYEAFGPLFAFLFSFSRLFFITPAAFCLVSLTCGKYIITAVYPNGGNQNNEYEKLIAACLMGVILIVNSINVKWATRVQIFFTSSKMIAIIILILTGFVRLGQGYNENFKDAFQGTNTNISDIGYAFYGGLWAYGGWSHINYLMEELKNPLRNLPLAIIITIPLVTISYVLVNVGYLTLMTPKEIASSGAVAVNFGYELYGKMGWIIPFLVACSTFGSSNGAMFTGGRLLHASARNGHMPKLLSMVHKKRHTPIPAMMFNCCTSWIMLIPKSTTISTLLNYFSFAAWFFFGSTVAGMLWLRYKKPDINRPFKVFIGVPIVVLLFCVYLVAAPFYTYPIKSLYGVIIISIGIPVYFAFVRFKIFPASVYEIFDNIEHKLETLFQLELPDNEFGEDSVKIFEKENEKDEDNNEDENNVAKI